MVHGASGVGKSRLLAGLVAERLRREPGSAVAHLDAEAFAAACVEAAEGRDPSGARGPAPARGAAGRHCETGSAASTCSCSKTWRAWSAPHPPEMSWPTRSTLLEIAGAAVVVSARSAPGTWPRPEWPARLVNRLLGGLTVRIDPPGLASRRRYVLHAAGQNGVTLQADAVERLAEAADGYRTLDGWIARLALEARLGPASRAGGGRGRETRAQRGSRRAGGTTRASTRRRSPRSWRKRPSWPGRL